MRRKKGMELSVNFLVIMVLSIVILSGSFFLIGKFFKQADKVKLELDSATEREIRQMLFDGSKVAVPINRIEIGKNEVGTFGVGVFNVLNTDPENQFTMTLLPKNVGGCDAINLEIQTASQGLQFSKNIRNNEQFIFLVAVKATRQTSACTYVIDAHITYDGSEEYGNVKKLYVDVK